MISSGFRSENNKQSVSNITWKKDFDLDLDFRQASTTDIGGKVEFFDVCHHFTDSSIFGLVTKDHIKPSARDMCFLNGASHHPQPTFKSIVHSEAIHLRRLNEKQSDFNESLNIHYTEKL